MDTFGTIKGGGTGKAVASVVGTATAAGSGDDTWVYSEGFDRLPQGGQQYDFAEILAAAECVLGSAATGVLSVKLQHDDDPAFGTVADFTDEYGSGVHTATAVDATAGEKTHLTAPFAISGAKKYIRAAVKVNLSAGGTDTATVFGILRIGGAFAGPLTD